MFDSLVHQSPPQLKYEHVFSSSHQKLPDANFSVYGVKLKTPSPITFQIVWCRVHPFGAACQFSQFCVGKEKNSSTFIEGNRGSGSDGQEYNAWPSIWKQNSSNVLGISI